MPARVNTSHLTTVDLTQQRCCAATLTTLVQQVYEADLISAAETLENTASHSVDGADTRLDNIRARVVCQSCTPTSVLSAFDGPVKLGLA